MKLFASNIFWHISMRDHTESFVPKKSTDFVNMTWYRSHTYMIMWLEKYMGFLNYMRANYTYVAKIVIFSSSDSYVRIICHLLLIVFTIRKIRPHHKFLHYFSYVFFSFFYDGEIWEFDTRKGGGKEYIGMGVWLRIT